jgi:hypothetical protein
MQALVNGTGMGDVDHMLFVLITKSVGNPYLHIQLANTPWGI